MTPLAIVPAPLLAAGLDWLEALLPVLFVVFWIVSQLVAVVRKVAGGGGEPPRQAPPPQVRRPRPLAADRVGGGELQDEIREFLRREVPVRPAAPSRPSPPPSPRPARPRPVPQAAERAKATPLEPTRPVGGVIAERVREDFARELEHLSTPLTADRELVSPTPSGVAESASPASEIVRSLRNPATLRQLIVVREILDRPVDRW